MYSNIFVYLLIIILIIIYLNKNLKLSDNFISDTSNIENFNKNLNIKEINFLFSIVYF